MRKAGSSKPGFTLIEVTTSLTLVSVLMLGLSSAVMIASRALPTPQAGGEFDREVIDVLNRLREELREAYEYEVRTDGAGVQLRMKLTDAGGAGWPEEIEYNYIKADGKLTRRAKDQDERVVLTGISGGKIATKSSNGQPAALNILLRVPDTIQGTFEAHALLPQAPLEK